MRSFDNVLADVTGRPGSYLGKPSLRLLSTYFDGYSHALRDSGHPDPLHAWPQWIFHRFQISHSAWHWTRVLLHIYGTDAKALSAVPLLYAEFASQRESLNVDAMDAELSRQLEAKYGDSCHEPESTQTTAEF